jgi:hypothetical protein
MGRSKIWFSGIILTLLIAVNVLTITALAHVPTFEAGGKSPDAAIPFEDPSISRVLYGQLAEGDLTYYSFEIKRGERIVLGLTIPVEQGRQGFTPDLILMGPGLTDEGKIPEKLEVPQGYGVKVFSGRLLKSPVYEAFAPSAFYSVANPDLIAPESGKYYAVVSSARRAGNYGVVLGYKEAFTLNEWISTPLSQIKIYLWEGQSPLLVFAPFLIILALGILAICLKKDIVAGFSPAQISGIFAGLFFLGTGFSLISQMMISLSKTSFTSEIFITLFLILASVGLGVIAFFLSLKGESSSEALTRQRFYFLGLGILGLLLWAGLFIGPLLSFLTALLPWKNKE